MAKPCTGSDVLKILTQLGSEPASNMTGTTLLTDAGVDSFDVIQLAEKLKKGWGVDFDSPALFKLGTADKIAAG